MNLRPLLAAVVLFATFGASAQPAPVTNSRMVPAPVQPGADAALDERQAREWGLRSEVGALPATDAGAARGLFAPARSAHDAGHRGPQRGGAQALRRAAGAGRGPARRQDAGLPAGLRRGVAAPVSRPAAREPARRQGAGCRQHRLRAPGGLRQGRLRTVRATRAAVAGGRHSLRSLHGRQPSGRRAHPAVGRRRASTRPGCAPAPSRSTTMRGAGCRSACPAICRPWCAE